MSKRHIYQFVKDVIEGVKGYKLISTIYENTISKLSIQCPNGHLLNMSFSKFSQGQRCHLCKYDEMRNDYSYVKNFIEKEGFKLFSTEYKNAGTNLEIQCPNGHTYLAPWNTFMRGSRCKKCANIQSRNTIKEVKDYIEGEGYSVLSTDYVVGEKIKVQCPAGHSYDVKYPSFRRGNRCFICQHDKRKFTHSNIKKIIENDMYTLVSDTYINVRKKIDIKCPKGHLFKMRFTSFHKGQRCPICSRVISNPEKDMLRYIKTIYNNTIKPNDRKTLFNYWTKRWLEIDVLLPELNKAIEYNSNYWHSSDITKWKDMIKIRQCKMRGIELLIINDFDWKNNKIETMNKIKGFILK